jgi:hypothetical protein
MGCSSMTETVDLERSNPFPIGVSCTGTPFTKGQNPRRWCHFLSTRFLPMINDHCSPIWWWLDGSLESSWKVQEDGFFVCFTCARFDQEIRTIPINAQPNSEEVIVVTWLGAIWWNWGLEFKWPLPPINDKYKLFLKASIRSTSQGV